MLHHLLGQYRWRDILAHVHAIPPFKVWRAVFFTVAGYGFLTLYDALYRWCRDASGETHNWPTNKAKP